MRITEEEWHETTAYNPEWSKFYDEFRNQGMTDEQAIEHATVAILTEKAFAPKPIRIGDALYENGTLFGYVVDVAACRVRAYGNAGFSHEFCIHPDELRRLHANGR